MCNLVACAAVFVILQTILEIVAFWSLKAGLSNSAKDKTSRESLLISLQPRAAGVATGIFTWSCYPTPGWWGGSISSATSVAPNLFGWRATFWNPNPWRAKLTTRGGVQIDIFHTFNIVNMLIYIAEQIHDRGGVQMKKISNFLFTKSMLCSRLHKLIEGGRAWKLNYYQQNLEYLYSAGGPLQTRQRTTFGPWPPFWEPLSYINSQDSSVPADISHISR